jgi:hypothetical protein
MINKKKDLSAYGLGFYTGVCTLGKMRSFNDQVEIRVFDLVRAVYFYDEEILADFIDECCFFQKGCKTSASDLYRSFRRWYKLNLMKPVPSQKKFGTKMSKRFDREKDGIFYYFDIGLNKQILRENNKK